VALDLCGISAEFAKTLQAKIAAALTWSVAAGCSLLPVQ